MSEKLNIFIGYDSNEIVAYHVLCQSILEKCTIPVSFTPLNLKNLGNIFSRERNSLQSTEFSFSRFLVPYLSNYEGWSLFLDCDIIVRSDLKKLFEYCDEEKSVMVCKHDYVPIEETKFLGQVQTKYEKKNWSSVMLFNNSKCRALSLDYVNNATGLELHQFKWLEDERKIGEIPLSWNWLVGEYNFSENADLVHFTIGGPYFEEYRACDYAVEWKQTYQRTVSVNERLK